MNDNNIKNEQQLLLNSERQNIENNSHKNELLNLINNIKNLLEKNIPQNGALLFKKINIILIKITSLFDYLLKENELVLKNERMLRKEENSIRKLYNNIFYLKTTIDYQENTILNFVSKEKEYEKLKEKTGAFYSNGKLIYNGRKDNEIMILRTENSNLKSFIEAKEKEIEKKDNEILKLKEQLLLYNKNRKNNEKKRFKNKNNSLPNFNDLKYSYSNININFNEISHSDILKDGYKSIFKNQNKSTKALTGKTIYIPPQLRNDLSLKELFSKRNIYNLYHHKKIKKKKFSENNSKLNLLSNADKYISVNKSNYNNILTTKKHERFFSNTINPDMGINPVFNSPFNEIKNKRNILNLKAYNEKELIQKKFDKKANKINNKIQYSSQGKKIPFYSNFASPISKYSKNNLKKNKLFLK